MPKQKKNKSKKAKGNKKQDPIYQEPKKKKKESKKEKKRNRKYPDNDPIEEEFIEELKKLGYYIKEVDSDGNCLFRAVSDQLENHEYNFDNYRQKTVDYMRDNIDYFKNFIEDEQTVEEYIDNMSQNKEWGGNLEIYAMSMALHVNFYIYIYQQPIYIVKNWDDPKQNIMLTYHDGLHYNSLRKIGDGQEKNDEDSSEDEINDIQGLIDNVDHLNI